MAEPLTTPGGRSCEACGATLLRKIGEKPVHWKRRKYCDLDCARHHRRPKVALEARFEAKVSRADGCHEWQGARNGDGYGTIYAFGRSELAHRVAWALAEGDLPAEQVLHSCDNPGCVNRAHLFLGDHAANMADMSQKGRGRSRTGQAHHAAKLNPELVRQIRADRREHREIAADYGVSHAVVGSIKRRETWKHVT